MTASRGTTIEGSCHCGAVRYEVDVAPETVTTCACSICRRYATLWAYKVCGCVTHWAPVDKAYDRMAVNARLMAPAAVAAAKLREIEAPGVPG